MEQRLRRKEVEFHGLLFTAPVEEEVNAPAEIDSRNLSVLVFILTARCAIRGAIRFLFDWIIIYSNGFPVESLFVCATKRSRRWWHAGRCHEGEQTILEISFDQGATIRLHQHSRSWQTYSRKKRIIPWKEINCTSSKTSRGQIGCWKYNTLANQNTIQKKLD